MFTLLARSHNCENRLLASSCMSVCSSVRMEQLGSHRTDFHDIWHCQDFFFFENMSRKFKFNQNLKRMTCTLHKDQQTFMIISGSVLLKIINVSDKVVETSQTIHFMFNFHPHAKILPFIWDSVETYCRAGQAIGKNMARAHYILDK